MNWKQAISLAAGCALMSAPAFSQTGAATGSTGSSMNPSTSMSTPPSTTTTTATRMSREAMVLAKIHHSNQHEIELANLAKQNASSDEVKKFADRIVTDHSKADDQVLAFAKSHNIDLPAPGQMAAMHQMPRDEASSRAMGSATGEQAQATSGTGGAGVGHSADKADHESTMTKLRNLKGPEFDREFVNVMVKDHQKTIDRLTQARSEIKDADEVALIDKLLPTLKQHLSMAQKIQGSLKS